MRLAAAVAVLAAVAAVAAAPPVAAAEGDPPWSAPVEQLAAALECPATFSHPDREPVLLVHGTFTSGREQYGWNYLLLLAERGFDACVVSYPDRGFGDQQVAAEYVAHAVQEIHRRTGSTVDVVGHSQGGIVPRWAIKFWPSVQAVVDDAVLVAPPSHGTSIAAGIDEFPIPVPPAFHQFDPGSAYVRAVNAADETPGDVSWTVLYSHLDELVRPVAPVPTAALDWGREGPLVRNIAVDEVCPGRVVDHLTIGTTDRLSQELVLDALANGGPADPARLGPRAPLCALPDQYVVPDTFRALAEQLARSFQDGLPAFEAVDAEPPLRPYAARFLAGASGPSGPSGPSVPSGSSGPSPAGAVAPVVPPGDAVRRAATTSGPALPATGRPTPIALLGGLVAAGVVLRRAIRCVPVRPITDPSASGHRRCGMVWLP